MSSENTRDKSNRGHRFIEEMRAYAEFLDRSWLQNIAPSVVMLLVLIPMITFEEVDHALGDGSLKRLLFGRSDHA